MTEGPSNSAYEEEFNIQEGAQSEHCVNLEEGQTIHWGVSVDYGYDIRFSIHVNSRVNGVKGTWIAFEPERIATRDGYLEAADLLGDGIQLPASIVFRLDNSYSWYNSKRAVLKIRKSQEIPNSVESIPDSPDSARAPSRRESNASRESENRALREGRTRIDLLWMNHVMDEALMRCPQSIPEIKRKIEEIKELLKPHIKAATFQAII
jgi:hypothetical protein